MKNREFIEYTYKHRKIVMLLANKYFKGNKEILEQVEYHDLDKLYMYLFYDKKIVSKIHRENSNHHDNDLEKSYNDYVEMVLDWESARYTKPDKPLNAYDTLYKYYSDLSDKILPILKDIGIDKSNMPMEQDVVLYAKDLENVVFEDIEKETNKYLHLLIK